jgi:rhodanese-related sulfurtransferase
MMISVDELTDALQSTQMMVIDVREACEVAATGSIPGALFIPLDELRHRINDIPRDVPIVCICASGIRAQVAVDRLEHAGFCKVYNLLGGMKRWFARALVPA